MTGCCLLVILTIFHLFESQNAQNYPYKHYSRQTASNTNYENATIMEQDDDSNMCHLTIRCPSLPSLYPYDHDARNRRFSVDTYLAMHGPPGPPGVQGPIGNPGPRGAVGPQGEVGRSKQLVPIVAFMAFLQKMLVVEANSSAPIVFENADTNEGNSYNTTTGIFTAAYRGIYKFSITLMAQMDSIATARIMHNHQNMLGAVRCDCRRRFSHARASLYIELDVNDQVAVEAIGDPYDSNQAVPRNNIYGYTYTHFSGLLLFLTDNSLTK